MNQNGHNQHRFEFVDFKLYPEERLLLQKEKRIPLTPRVLDLLLLLVQRHGELVSKEAILESVWADTIVEEGNINRTVSTLRHHLGVQPNGNDFIETVPKSGYRFIAPVQDLSEPSIVAGALPLDKNHSDINADARGSENRKRGLLILVIIAAAALLFGAGGLGGAFRP